MGGGRDDPDCRHHAGSGERDRRRGGMAIAGQAGMEAAVEQDHRQGGAADQIG